MWFSTAAQVDDLCPLHRSVWRRPLARWLRFVDHEPGDGLGGGAGDLGDHAAAVVVDPPDRVGRLDGQCLSGVDDADVDALLGNDERAVAGDASLHAQRLGSRRGWPDRVNDVRRAPSAPGSLGSGFEPSQLQRSRTA
jgi:hypothetical protein